MFVTMPPFEQFMPSSLVEPDQKYWHAVTLSLELPWYLFVYEAEYEGQRVPQTTLVAWESTLLDILATIPAAHRRAIGRLEKERGKTARWQLSWVQSIWAPSSDEADGTGLFLLQLEGDPQVRDAHLQPVPKRSGRELLFTAAPHVVDTLGMPEGTDVDFEAPKANLAGRTPDFS